jgi:hypothetical protein
LAVLRTAVVLPERNQHTAALTLAVGRIALQVLQVGDAAVEIGAQLLYLCVDGYALLRLTAEECEQAAPFAALSPRLRADAVKVDLLPVDLKPPDVGGPGRFAIAPIDRNKLPLEAQADRVAAAGARTARRTIWTTARERPLGVGGSAHKDGGESACEHERQHAGADGAP